MNLIALPTSTANRKWTVWLLAPLAAALAVGTLWLLVGGHQGPVDLGPSMIHHVVPIDLDIKIAKDGELQAINNIDIVSEVEGSTTIQTLVKEGASVKKGDVLMTLDSSVIKQKIEDTTLDLQKAEADVTTAREMKDIQESQNAANLEAAQVALILAQLDFKQYEEGTYPQQLSNAKTDLDMAQINLKNQAEKLGQTRTLFSKGFVTATAIKDDELTVTTARNTVAKAQTELKVLSQYTHQMDLAAKQNAVSQAEQRLARVRRENASNLSQRAADVKAKEQALALLKRRMERLQEQLAACTITAPADGLVVYASSGDRNAQNPIQEGAQVRERQLLLRLPDTSSMKAVLRIQEAQVSRIHEGQRARVKIVGIPDPVGATLSKISVLADSGQRWWNPDLKEYPVDLVLDYTPAGIKPGMGTTAEIFIDRAEGVLAVPLAAIYSAGQDIYLFVRQGDQFLPRKVRVGRTNEVQAEILDGAIKNGEDVLILQVGQGQQLLEKAGIKVTPTTQPHDETRPHRGGKRGGAMEEAPKPGAVGQQPAAEAQPLKPSKPEPVGMPKAHGQADAPAAPVRNP